MRRTVDEKARAKAEGLTVGELRLMDFSAQRGFNKGFWIGALVGAFVVYLILS